MVDAHVAAHARRLAERAGLLLGLEPERADNAAIPLGIVARSDHQARSGHARFHGLAHAAQVGDDAVHPLHLDARDGAHHLVGPVLLGHENRDLQVAGGRSERGSGIVIDKRGLVNRPVVGHQRAALATGRDDLEIIQAERPGVAPAPRAPPLVAAADHLARVFQHLDAARPGDGHDLFHVGGPAQHVHGNDRLGVRPDLPLEIGGVKRHGLVHFRQHGNGAHGQHGGGGGQPGVGGHDDLVAGSHAHAREAAHDGGRSAAAHQQAVGGSDLPGPLLLEAVDFLQVAGLGVAHAEQLLGQNDLGHLIDFFLAHAIHRNLLV